MIPGGLLISIIELDGQPIGLDLSFLCKGVGFGHALATDGAFDKEGLGQLLVHHVFTEAEGGWRQSVRSARTGRSV
jgi:hypothetical protein